MDKRREEGGNYCRCLTRLIEDVQRLGAVNSNQLLMYRIDHQVHRFKG
jgi:hypothetical protein